MILSKNEKNYVSMVNNEIKNQFDQVLCSKKINDLE